MIGTDPYIKYARQMYYVLSYWPFQSVCSTYRKAEESCDEDWQCPLHYFCWYNTKEERREGKKRCMEIWQADVGT